MERHGGTERKSCIKLIKTKDNETEIEAVEKILKNYSASHLYIKLTNISLLCIILCIKFINLTVCNAKKRLTIEKKVQRFFLFTTSNIAGVASTFKACFSYKKQTISFTSL